MRRERRGISRLDRLSAFRELCVDVAEVSHHFARLLHRLGQLLLEWRRIEGGMWPIAPVDLQTLAPLQCGPGVTGNDRDTAERLEQVWRLEGVKDDRLHNALYSPCFFIVHASDNA